MNKIVVYVGYIADVIVAVETNAYIARQKILKAVANVRDTFAFDGGENTFDKWFDYHEEVKTFPVITKPNEEIYVTSDGIIKIVKETYFKEQKGVKQKKVIYFDLDGTIFDLYGKTNWLALLETENTTAFDGDFLTEIDKQDFFNNIKLLISVGFEFGVITWLPKDASRQYKQKCRYKKEKWVKQNLPFIKYFHCISYNVPKQNYIDKNVQQAFLIDDNVNICTQWTNTTQFQAINVNKKFPAHKALDYIMSHCL